MGAAVIILPPAAEKSPATGAVITTENPATYVFPSEGLSERIERAAEKEDGGVPAANALVGIRSEMRRIKRKRFI
jgi:hypothetical protein